MTLTQMAQGNMDLSIGNDYLGEFRPIQRAMAQILDSKMAANLRGQGLIEFPKYGYITLTEWGRRMGAYLVHRHQVVGRLLCTINQTESELEEVEKIEHFLSPRTVANIEKFLEGLETPSK